MEKVKKVVVLHSGGLDSTALLYHLRDEGFEVLPISIHYGQRHWKELNAASEICIAGGFRYNRVELLSLRNVLAGSSQTDFNVDVPEGHYSAENMAITVVPNRNMILLSIAVAYAISTRSGYVAYAAHAGDHAQYPDCREEFIQAIYTTIRLCDDSAPQLIAPYAAMSKADVVADGVSHGAHLELTWSCYKGGENHCGRCGTCVERAEAFSIALGLDPTVYDDPDYWRSVCKND